MEFFNEFFSNDCKRQIQTICISCKTNEVFKRNLCTKCCEKSIDTLISLIKTDKLDMSIMYIDWNISNEIWLKPVYDQVKDIDNSSANYYCGFYFMGGWSVEEDSLKGIKYMIKSIKQGNKYAEEYIRIIKEDCCEDYTGILFDGFFELENENIELKRKIEMLEMENADLRYRPGGVGYQEAREDFETHMEKNE
jgi:hypothetical protein